jgi:hypothetical protein
VHTDDGPVVLGPNGSYHLETGHVVGENPLAVYSPTTPGHLRRAAAFATAPDIYFGSSYDPVKDEGMSFEGQMGYHGGIGGEQQRPFVFYPSHWRHPDGDIVGCAALHDQMVTWLADLRGAQGEPSPTGESAARQAA